MSFATYIAPNEIDWQETGYDDDPRCRLLATLEIGSPNTTATVHMHLEAVEVRNGEPVYAEREGVINDLLLSEGIEAFSTINIEGRGYILYAVPFSA